MLRKISVLLLLLQVFFCGCDDQSFEGHKRRSMVSNSSLSTKIDKDNGGYSVAFSRPEWIFGGSVGEGLSNITQELGADKIGMYRSVSFDFNDVYEKQGSIRIYQELNAVMFTLKYLEPVASQKQKFPEFGDFPRGMYALNLSAEAGEGLDVENMPRVFLDDVGRCFIVSPADNFDAAVTSVAGQELIGSGLRATFRNIPREYMHKSIVVAGEGVNSTFERWGEILRGTQGKSSGEAATYVNGWLSSFRKPALDNAIVDTLGSDVKLTDGTYVRRVRGDGGAEICYASSEHLAGNIYYLLGYSAGDAVDMEFCVRDLFGERGKYFVYDYKAGTGGIVRAKDEYSGWLAEYNDFTGYYILSPVGDNGIAILGDVSKYVSCGKARVSGIENKGKVTEVTMLLDEGEKSVYLTGYSERAVQAYGENCWIGEVSYDDQSGLFRIEALVDDSERMFDDSGDVAAEIIIGIEKY